jgi:hypothetical protein
MVVSRAVRTVVHQASGPVGDCRTVELLLTFFGLCYMVILYGVAMTVIDAILECLLLSKRAG